MVILAPLRTQTPKPKFMNYTIQVEDFLDIITMDLIFLINAQE